MPSPPARLDISDDILGVPDDLWEVEQQVRTGAALPASLDRVAFSVCRDRAWFTPMGCAYSPRNEFPSGSRGSNREFGVLGMAKMGALLSIPIRIDGVVVLGLLSPGEDLGFPSNGELLSGDHGYRDRFTVELLADPFNDDANEPGGRVSLAGLPVSVTSVPIGQELVGSFIGGFIEAMGRVLLQEGGRGLERVDVDTSLRTAWANILTELRSRQSD